MEATYLVTGSLVVQNTAAAGQLIQLPQMTLFTGRRGTLPVSDDNIDCPSLAVPAGGSMHCSFTVSYVGQQPLPGNISAKVTAAGTLVPYTARAPQVRYQFSGAKVLNVGSIAKVSNFFEQGPGIMQPFGVTGGLQPPPDMNLEDSRQFNYLAMFGNTDSAKCGNRWQVSFVMFCLSI